MYIIPTNKSDIAEVRDQLCLDFAEGKYLTVVSNNLGLVRPSTGYSDAVWRAVTKAIALQYKQITTKYEEVLTIVLGPKVTQCGALAQDVTAGATFAVLVKTSQFPQVGTMVLDEGLVSEETVQYTYIDRQTNVVYFDTPLTKDHTAVGAVWETGVISTVAPMATALNVFDVTGFPDPMSPYTVCVGRGTAYEAAVPLTAVNTDARKLSASLALGVSGVTAVSGIQLNLDGGITQQNAHSYFLDSVDTIPVTGGHLQTSQLTTSLTATAGTTTTVTVAGPLSVSRYGGFWIRFNGNVTASLANDIAYVEDNTATTFTFANALGAAPAVGDTFELLSNFQYIRADESEVSVTVSRELPDLRQLPANCQFSVMKPTATVSIAQVQVKGVGWDVFQSDPNHVEILLPNNMLKMDLRSASYIREAGLAGSTTATLAASVGDTEIEVADATLLPPIGVLSHNIANTRYAYVNPHTWLTADAAAAATSIDVLDTSLFPTTGTLVIAGGVPITYTVVDETTLSVAALPVAVRRGDTVRSAYILSLSKELTSSVAIADVIDFYSSYDSGDIWNVDDVWPGPYVWDLSADAVKSETVLNNSATAAIVGPTKLTVDRQINSTVLEVDDASSFSTAVPYSLLLGENNGNVETLSVQQVSLKSRTYGTTTVAVTPADSPPLVTLASLSGPVAPLHQFPDGGPYRIVISPFTVNAEVLEVTGTSGTSLELARNSINTHAIGAQVVLLADLIRISPATADEHVGKIAWTNRLGLYGAETQTDRADIARPLHTSFTLALSPVDFDTSDGVAVVNFGNGVVSATSKLVTGVAAAAASIVLDDSTKFPTSGYPYTVRVDVGAGPLREEILHVTNNNTGTGTLTLSHVTVFSHDTGRRVQFVPGIEESIGYTTQSAGVITTTPYITVESTHFTMERVSPSVGTGYPRTTGFDFPLRIPITLEEKIRVVIDLIRAAGIYVTFVSKR